MIIAQEKRKTNIVEYILYMYQVEDTLRACAFDMQKIDASVISQFKVSAGKQSEIRDWYANIIVSMHKEEVNESGHISQTQNMVSAINELHKQVIATKTDSHYMKVYAEALPNISIFEKKLGREPINEIDTCINAIYALLLLRLQKKEVTEETMAAMKSFSNLLSLLAERYRKFEENQGTV